MFRSIMLALISAVLAAAPVSAQEWAKKMFKTTKHNFGSVARGSKAEFDFEFQNLYKEDIHVASVRTSCGCTTPSITKDTLKSWEKSSIHARFNTPSFLGQKGATVTVVIDKPYYAEVQLQVSGFIRGDVVFEPGVVNFGQLDQGVGSEVKVRVVNTSRTNWNIVDIRSANPSFEVELGDAVRTAGQVAYPMTVRLKKEAPIGFLNDQLTIVSDDAQNQTIPLSVEGRIQAAIELSPASLTVGVLQPGQVVTKQLVVKGRKPFKVMKVGCENNCFEFRAPSSDESKALHLIPITFTAGQDPGAFTTTIKIETDLGHTAECLASGTVKAPEVEAETENVQASATLP